MMEPSNGTVRTTNSRLSILFFHRARNTRAVDIRRIDEYSRHAKQAAVVEWRACPV